MKEYFFYLMFYSFIGWACESIYVSIGQKKLVNSGFMTGPFCPIYGFGAVFGILLLTPFIQNPVLVFLFGILVTSVLEYFTSWLMEAVLHVRWWDYSHYKYHINGRVCLLNSILFGIMSLVLIYGVHPFIYQWVSGWQEKTLTLTTLVLAVYLIIDFSASLAQFISFRQELSKFETAIQDIRDRIVENTGLDIQERFNALFEEKDAQFFEFRNHLHENYARFRENRRFAIRRLRHAFPNMRISPKHEFRAIISTLHDKYDETKK